MPQMQYATPVTRESIAYGLRLGTITVHSVIIDDREQSTLPIVDALRQFYVKCVRRYIQSNDVAIRNLAINCGIAYARKYKTLLADVFQATQSTDSSS